MKQTARPCPDCRVTVGPETVAGRDFVAIRLTAKKQGKTFHAVRVTTQEEIGASKSDLIYFHKEALRSMQRNEIGDCPKCNGTWFLSAWAP